MRQVWSSRFAACLLLAGCQASSPAPASDPVTPSLPLARSPARAGAPKVTLNVALYPYVPRLDQFKMQINAAWQQAEPSVGLKFVDWDGGYKQNPGDLNADVFVFDAINFELFRSQGWLAALSAAQIANITDFLPYAVQGVQAQGSYYAIPMLGCTDILFYRKGDAQLASATTLSQLSAALGTCSYTSQVPPDARGLLVDLAGGTTNACLYVDAAEAVSGQWPVPLPWDPAQLDPRAIDNLRTLLQMASFYNATGDTPAPYQRGTWFAQGFGRAAVGYSESMSVMGAALADVDFKLMPLSDDAATPRLVYSDVVGINPKSASPALALELANLMTSTAVMVASTGPSGGQSAQYLMPARSSVFQLLGQGDVIYLKMQALVQAANPVLFNLGLQSRSWIEQMKAPIENAVRANYGCGCDQNAGPLFNQSDANAKCPGACASHGGWNGQWRTIQSGVQSACGCKSCFVTSASK